MHDEVVSNAKSVKPGMQYGRNEKTVEHQAARQGEGIKNLQFSPKPSGNLHAAKHAAQGSRNKKPVRDPFGPNHASHDNENDAKRGKQIIEPHFAFAEDA